MKLPYVFQLCMLSTIAIGSTGIDQTQQMNTEESYLDKRSTSQNQAKETPNLKVLCGPDPYAEHIVLPPPPLTGTERETPIVLMTRKQFNDKIQMSPLWDYLDDKRLNNGNYGDSYTLVNLGNLIGSNGYISVHSEYGPFWYDDQRLTTIKYSNHGTIERSPYKHQLIDQERYEMIEALTLVIEDRYKAAQIIDTLYQQYMDKVNNEDYLSDGQTIHTFVKYDGKFISMSGYKFSNHHIPECNYEYLEGITIN